MYKKELMNELNDIAKNGKKFRSAQIIMIRLSRLALKDGTVKDAMEDGEKLVGIISRGEAVKQNAGLIVECMDSEDFTAVRRAQKNINELVNGYRGRQTSFVTYDLNTSKVYRPVKYSQAVKVLNGVVEACQPIKNF